MTLSVTVVTSNPVVENTVPSRNRCDNACLCKTDISVSSIQSSASVRRVPITMSV